VHPIRRREAGCPQRTEWPGCEDAVRRGEPGGRAGAPHPGGPPSSPSASTTWATPTVSSRNPSYSALARADRGGHHPRKGAPWNPVKAAAEFGTSIPTTVSAVTPAAASATANGAARAARSAEDCSDLGPVLGTEGPVLLEVSRDGRVEGATQREVGPHRSRGSARTGPRSGPRRAGAGRSGSRRDRAVGRSSTVRRGTRPLDLERDDRHRRSSTVRFRASTQPPMVVTHGAEIRHHRRLPDPRGRARTGALPAQDRGMQDAAEAHEPWNDGFPTWATRS
jgi:hypothetical protein